MLNRWMLRRLFRRVGHHFHSTGLLVGAFFFAMSLAPSLLPRAAVVQGVISGLSVAAGYGLAIIGYWLWNYFHLPLPRVRIRWLLQVATGLLSLLFALAFLWRASDWQNNIRELMGMEPTTGVGVTTIAVVALLVFLAVLLLARLFRFTFHSLFHHLQRYIPRRVSFVAGLLASFIVFWLVIDGVLFTFALRAADRSYQQIDALMEAQIEQPLDLLATGSDSSLLNWHELGRQGRRYLSSGPQAEDIARYAQGPVMTPLRVYVGLNSADTAQERATLALEELKRVGAFQRSLLVLITPTGTGWVDPGSIDSIEYLHRGDVASVAAQYSYLPSPLSLLSEGEYGVEMARSLFQEVYGYWSSLPVDNRPALYLLGLSLGALNSDLSFDFYDIIEDPFDGVLWSGPPFRSETWRSVTERRQADSPAWLPRFRDGSVVRFVNQHGGLNLPDQHWGTFRIAFLQYASDPITFFDPRAYYQEPEWMQAPRGHDVSADLRWFPIVTMLQLVADMAAGSSPVGFGHNYAPEHYHDTWLALTEPGNWSESDLERLRQMHKASY